MLKIILAAIASLASLQPHGQAQNLIVNSGAESGLIGWADPTGNGFLSFASGNFAFRGARSFSGFNTGPSGAWVHTLQQDVDVTSYSTMIDSGTADCSFQAYAQSRQGGGPIDEAVIRLEFLDTTGQPLGAGFNSGVVVPVNQYNLVEYAAFYPVGTRMVRIILESQRFGGSQTDAFFDELFLAAPNGSIGTVVCDGTGCPCSNDSNASNAGCQNSTGTGGTLRITGSTSLAAGALEVSASGLPPHSFALAVTSPSPMAAPQNLGNGLLCVDSQFSRVEVARADQTGTVHYSPSFSALAGWQPGETAFLQVVYRDVGGPCAAPINTSGSASLILAP